MARRIAVVVVALIMALLAVLAVPLGLLTASQNRRDFRDETTSRATVLANVAEERIDDNVRGPALGRSIRELERQGDRVAIFDAAGNWVAGTSGWPHAQRLITRPPAVAPGSTSAPGAVLVTVPVVPDSGRGAVGTVVLSRPTGSLDHRITVLWTLIGVVSAAGLAAAVTAAALLARWASAPITILAAAASRLGEGALDSRAPARGGPPEVQRLSATFNTMAARLESLIRGHQSMMAEVSHQVRTPLAALRLRLDLLAQDADEPTAAELAGAQEEIARLSRLLNGLLAVARAENVTAVPGPVDVGEVLADRASAWRPAAEERGVNLDAAASGSVIARAAAGHLEQILDNLIANALDALDGGGTVRLRAAARDGMALVKVADDGSGMTQSQQRAAFRRFASGTPGGTGLGLAIVDRLAAAGGGSAALSDTPGGGLTVTVELPLATLLPARGRQERRAGGVPADINQF